MKRRLNVGGEENGRSRRKAKQKEIYCQNSFAKSMFLFQNFLLIEPDCGVTISQIFLGEE